MYVPIRALLKDANMTPYLLAKRAAQYGISMQAVYRLVRANGRLKRYDAHLLGALCEVFHIGPNELFVVDSPRPKRARKRSE